MVYQRAIASGCAILIAMMLGFIFVPTHIIWVVMTAFLACQTTLGTPYRQSLIIMIMMLIMAMSVFLLMKVVEVCLVVMLMAGLLFDNMGLFIWIAKAGVGLIFLASSYYLYLHRAIKKNDHFLMRLIPLISLFVLCMPLESFQNRKELMLAIVMGGLITMTINIFIFYGRWEKMFTDSMIHLLKKYKECLQAFVQYIIRHCETALAFGRSNSKRIGFEGQLYQQIDHYPEWIYEAGLNPGVRSGFRYFLIHVDNIMELFFSMDYLITRFIHAEKMKSEKGEAFWEAVLIVMKNNEAILTHLKHFFEKKEFGHQIELNEDIIELDNKLADFIPLNVALLDLSPFNLSVIGFVQDLKELRAELLQLHLSLPNR